MSLVVRTARGVQLTAFGQQLQVRARLIVAEMQRARDDIEQAQGAMTAVAAAITPAAAVTILPDAFRAFRRRFPVARVNLMEGFRASRCRACTTFARFRGGRRRARTAGGRIRSRGLYASRSLIVARRHPLASATSLAELVEADWLMNPSPESSTQVLFNSFVAYGLPVPARVVECPSFEPRAV